MGLFTRSLPNFELADFDALTHWFASPLGQHLLGREQVLLDQVLNKRFGYHLLQIGCADLVLGANSPISHRITLQAFRTGARRESMLADPEALPLATASVDCVVLHHALDYASDQHQLLREAARVLIAGGWLVILGFNPYSLWGLRNKLLRWQLRLPWRASLLSASRVCDWLNLLDFQVDGIRYAEYALPINTSKSWCRFSWFEALATYFNLPTGGIYLIAACKQVAPLTPVRRPRRRHVVGPLGMPVVEPAGPATSGNSAGGALQS
ncbi:MAG: class I SAM-dependent methyltransferase [Pseudohongiellaceae bacterium]|jgi:SAM-dependent methyltransferase